MQSYRWCPLVALAGLLVIPAKSFVRNVFGDGQPLTRADAARIQYFVANDTVAGMTNRDGEVVITADSHPVAALEAALETWSEIPGSRVRFARLLATGDRGAASNGRPIVTFSDTDINRSITGGAVAVTLLRTSQGQLTDTDIVFNPTFTFSTNLREETFDIRSAFTHELGHALGMDHSGVAGASLFATAARASRSLSVLTQDDEAFAREAYPGAELSAGRIDGTVILEPGRGAISAHVVAVDPESNSVTSALTDRMGVYRLPQLEPGDYLLYAEPLDGPAFPFQFTSLGGGFHDTSFLTTFFGGNDTPRQITVMAGATTVVNLMVPEGTASLNIEGGGAIEPPQGVRSFVGAVVEPGLRYVVDLFDATLGAPGISEDSLSLLGRGVKIVAGSFARDTVQFSDGTFPVVRFEIEVSRDAPPGLASVVIRASGETVVYSAGVKILPPRAPPQLAAAGVVNAGSFLSGPLAPGEIISIFGIDLAPEGGFVGRLNPVTGRLAAMIREVTVTIDGVAAPLFFVSAEQINAQVPVELAGKQGAVVVVRHENLPGVPVRLPVAAARPGLFTVPGTGRAVVLNQDSTLNSASNPAQAGEAVQIFATGPGEVTPALGTGEFAASDPLSTTLLPAQALFGGMTADVSFSGMAPGFVGLWQVNATVPADSPRGESVPLALRIGGAASQPAVVAVE